VKISQDSISHAAAAGRQTDGSATTINDQKRTDALTSLAGILVVEDERIVAIDLADTLTQLGYTVIANLDSGEAAIEQAVKLRPDLILMDIRLKGKIDGIQAAHEIRNQINVPIIYLTAHSDGPTLVRAKGTEPFGYLVKPFKAPELCCAIEIALHKHEVEAKLRERETWLSTTLRAIGDGVVTIDSDRKVTFLNPIAEALTGWQCQEAIGKLITEILSLASAETKALVENPIDRAMVERTSQTLNDDVILLAKTGTMIPIDDSATPILSESGNLLGGVMVFRDATQRRRAEDEIRRLNAELERRVLERTVQLEAANKELESFSYSIAHDLRAPLRGIDGFSEILANQHAANLSPEGLKCLQQIQAGVERMRQLIDDLLYLARVARCDLRKQEADISQIVLEVISSLQINNPNRQVETVVEDQIIAEVDARLLKIVIENLLGNAWKFTGRISTPKIEFGASEQDGGPVYYVRDNGVGFDMAYADKLFGVFQRLHSSEEFEGTGIGLAIAERIIQRHGGRIWAQSAPGQGATFYFVV